MPKALGARVSLDNAKIVNAWWQEGVLTPSDPVADLRTVVDNLDPALSAPEAAERVGLELGASQVLFDDRAAGLRGLWIPDR